MRTSIERTPRSELAKDSTWTISVTAPADLGVTVPAEITVPAGGTASFSIGLGVSALPAGAVRQAALELAYKKYRVRMPIIAQEKLPLPNLFVHQVVVQGPVLGDVLVFLVSANFTVAPVTTEGRNWVVIQVKKCDEWKREKWARL